MTFVIPKTCVMRFQVVQAQFDVGHKAPALVVAST